MKVGDLICYNAAGMKEKTLVLVLAIEKSGDWRIALAENGMLALIQWCLVGEVMPRKDYQKGAGNYLDRIHPGQMCWHPVGRWFEVVR